MEMEEVKVSNYWFNRANSLNESAIVLYKNLGQINELFDPCHLLAGLSIEVMCKAILVKQHKSLDETKYSHHRLMELVRAAGIELSYNQQSTVDLFEESVIWLSKYPSPKKYKSLEHTKEKYEKYRSRARALFKNVHPSGFVITADDKKWPSLENYQAIWEKLEKFYRETPTNNSDEY